MKRFKVIGLCLVAVFALSAVLAAGASAAAPEYFTCIKAPVKNTGNYSGKECSTAQLVAGTGKYERAAWNAGKKVTFKGKGSNPKNNGVNPFTGGPNKAGVIEGTTECKKEKLSGQMTGPKTATWKTEYSSCEAGGFSCKSKALTKGKITTDELESTLVFLDKAKTNVGILVVGKGPLGGGPGEAQTPRLAQYGCGPKEAPEAVNIEVFGSVLAEVNGNTEEAQKKQSNVVAEGPLKLQGVGGNYVEEALGATAAQNEEAAKGWWEYEEVAKACEENKPPFNFPPEPHSRAECEFFIGEPNPVPVKPDLLESVISGAQSGNVPDNQNGTTENKGEAVGITL